MNDRIFIFYIYTHFGQSQRFKKPRLKCKECYFKGVRIFCTAVYVSGR